MRPKDGDMTSTAMKSGWMMLKLDTIAQTRHMKAAMCTTESVRQETRHPHALAVHPALAEQATGG
jgi:hypothetical protein